MVPKRRLVKSRSSRNKIRWSRWIYRMVSLTFLGVIFYTIFFSGKLSVTDISVSGEKELDCASISGKVSSEISGKYLGLIDKNNILLIRNGKMENDLKTQFKKIEDIEIKRKFPGTILVNIRERQTPVIFLTGDKSLSIDENGIAYDEFPAGDSGTSAIFLRDLSASEVTIEETVLHKDYITYLVGIKDGLKKEADIEIDNNYETPSIVSSDIRVTTLEGWKIYFSADINLKKELDMLNVSLENKIEKSKRPDLEYIDLRSDNKVFYKFKDGSTEVSQDENQPDPEESAKEDKKIRKKKK